MRGASQVRAGIFIGIAAALGAASWPGSAAAERKRVGVPKFDGAQEAIVRKRAMQALKSEGYELVKSREIEAAVQSTGVSLDSNDGYKAIAKELALSAIVTGEVGRKKATLTVRNGADGSVLGEGSFAGANANKIAAEVGKGFWRRLGSAVQRGKVPSGAKAPQKAAVAEAPEDREETGGAGEEAGEERGGKAEGGGAKEREVAEESEAAPRKKKRKKEAEAEEEKGKEEEEEEEEAGGPRPTWLELGLGLSAFSRDLRYHQDATPGGLRAYKLGLGPAGVASIQVYPAALSTSGFVANLAVQIDIEQAFAISSTVGATTQFPNGATFPTIIHDYAAGARLRIPVGAHQLAASVTGGEHAFSFRSGTNADRTQLDIPDTIYRYVRPGVEARITVMPGLFIMAGGGYRIILNSAGQIHDDAKFFPHLTVAGVDFDLGASLRILPFLDVRVIADLRRYFYDMHSKAGDMSIAGGAVDQYLSVMGMAVLTLGGK
jgi:hypothetical protein